MNTQKIDDVNVAAMLGSLGFTQDRPALQIKKKNGKVKFVYFFKPVSSCGQHKLKEMIQAWDNLNFLTENPFHELSVMKSFSLNRNLLLDEIKQGKGMLTEVTHDGSDALVNLDAAKEELQKLFS